MNEKSETDQVEILLPPAPQPTGALSLAALLTDPDRFRDRAVCCVVSGGNVDPAVYRQILVS